MADEMLRVIAPITVTDAMMISTNVAENDYSEWDISTTYDADDRVIVATEHTVYQSVAGSNLGNDPADGDAEIWYPVMKTRTWRPFDEALSEAVTNSGTIQYLIEPTSLVRAVGLVGAEALYATVKVKTSGGSTLATQTIYLADYSEMVDAITMVTVTPGFRDKVIFDEVICTSGNRVEITIGDGSGSPTINEITLGDVVTIALPLSGAEIGINDYSEFTEDAWGGVTITERGYRDYTDLPLYVESGDVARLRRALAALRAKFALYYITTGTEDYGTTVYGRYDQLSTIVNGPQHSEMSLRILGVTYGA